MPRRLDDRDLLTRAAMWIATLQDDSRSLRERASQDDVKKSERREMLRLSRALSDAAAILETAAPSEPSPRVPAEKKRSTPKKKRD